MSVCCWNSEYCSKYLWKGDCTSAINCRAAGFNGEDGEAAEKNRIKEQNNLVKYKNIYGNIV